MSRIFISHSAANNAEAIAVRDWLVAEGWNDLFLELDPERGLRAGERWQEALKKAVHQCELVTFLISPAWAESKWCLAEFLLAKSLNKHIFAAVVEPTPWEAMPIVTAEWQITDLTAGQRDRNFPVIVPPGDKTVVVAFASDGLNRLRIGLQQAGLDQRYFAWPPAHDPMRPPYRGLRPLQADDAGIFFGRDAPAVEAIDLLRGLTEAVPPRVVVILGASGAGKSSFLRAGLLPRLGRDPRTFLPLPVIRPEHTAINGETGLVNALAGAFQAANLKISRGAVREAVQGGAAMLKPLLARLGTAVQPATDGGFVPRPATLVLSIDQGEELFLAEGQDEAKPFLRLLRDLVASDVPPVVAVFTIRSDNYERLQSAPELDGVHQETLSLPPMPKGSYAEIVKGPIRRLDGTARAIKIDDQIVDALLADIETGAAKDALPLLAFTLERLYCEFGATGHLTLDHYVKLGRVKGSIEAAVEQAFQAAHGNKRIPPDHDTRLTLLRRGLIPWLASIDPETRAPRRRVAFRSEIPADTLPMIDLIVEQRLLTADIDRETNDRTIEPAHEALLRQWQVLQDWLSEDMASLLALDAVKRASRDWSANARSADWLVHTEERLRAAEPLVARPDLALHLDSSDKVYLAACRAKSAAARSSRRRRSALAFGFALLLGLGGAGWWQQDYIASQFYWLKNVRPYILSAEKERSLVPGTAFNECPEQCPEMVTVPGASFEMGSDSEEHDKRASPKHDVYIASDFAVSKFEVTFAQWDVCVKYLACQFRPHDEGWGRGDRPVINVNWLDAREYVMWLSKITGRQYRLLTESEWEYLSQAGAQRNCPLSDEHSRQQLDTSFVARANCVYCGSKWDDTQTAPAGSFEPNRLGLYDLFGNVWEWVEDVYQGDHTGAPTDGSARTDGDARAHVIRGGAWDTFAENLCTTFRSRGLTGDRLNNIGFRVARTLGGRK